MNPAKVVEREVQAECGPVVLELLRESIRQARHATDLHTDSKALSLHNRSTDAGRMEVLRTSVKGLIGLAVHATGPSSAVQG